MKFSFHPEAEAEFFSAIEYYEDCEHGLGQSFSAEVFSAIQRILDYPAAWPVLDAEVRRCLTHRYPLGILYSSEQGGIYILAVMHLRREPDYWKSRRSAQRFGPVATHTPQEVSDYEDEKEGL